MSIETPPPSQSLVVEGGFLSRRRELGLTPADMDLVWLLATGYWLPSGAVEETQSQIARDLGLSRAVMADRTKRLKAAGVIRTWSHPVLHQYRIVFNPEYIRRPGVQMRQNQIDWWERAGKPTDTVDCADRQLDVQDWEGLA